MSLRKVAVDTAFVSSANLIRLLAQFFALPILSRLLSPSDYGLVAMTMPFIAFAMLITDAGIGMSLVRTAPAEDRVAWSSGFWAILGLGVGLALMMAAFAPLASYIFNEPQLQTVVLVLALSIVGQALAIIPGAELQQSKHFRTIAGIEVTVAVAGIMAAIVIGYMGGGVWALVGQQITFFTTRALLNFVLSSFRPRLVFSLERIKPHLVFGRDVLGVNLVSHFMSSIDNLVIGRVLGSTPVGFYSMAMQFIRLPTIIVTGPLQFVLYSHLVAIKEDTPTIRRTFLVVTRLLSIIIFPMVGMIAVAHAPIFTFLLSEKWAQSSTLFMLLAPAAVVQTMIALGGDIMLVLNRPDLRLRITIEFSVIWLCVLLIAVHQDVQTVAIAYSATTILYMPRTLRLVFKLIDCSLRSYIEAVTVSAIITAASILAYSEINRVFSLSEHTNIGLAALLAVTAIGVSTLVQYRSLQDESALLRRR